MVLLPGWLTVVSNTITQGYPFLCRQSLRQLQPVLEEPGECQVRASAGVQENGQREQSIKMAHILSHPPLMTPLLCWLVETVCGLVRKHVL